MKRVAERALAHCKQKFGNNGVRVDEQIDPSIAWRPTIQCRTAGHLIVAVEVADNLFPEIFKSAAFEISRFGSPIAVYQACSLDAYQQDSKQAKINLLRNEGFGIMTIDDGGLTIVQHHGIPIAQHIGEKLCEKEIKGLSPSLKLAFRNALTTYGTNIGQGLQQAGQIIEGMVMSLSRQAAKDGMITNSQASGAAADVIDLLYQAGPLRHHRAALGAARAFMKEYRNIASHPAKTAKQAVTKMSKCRAGFLDAISTATSLYDAAQHLGYRLKVNVT